MKSFEKLHYVSAATFVCVMALLCLLSFKGPATSLTKIGHVRLAYLISRLPDTKNIENQLDIEKYQVELQIKATSKEIEYKTRAYESTALSEAVREDKREELRGIKLRLEEMIKNLEKQQVERRKVLMKPILVNLKKTIQQVALENRFLYVLNLDEAVSEEAMIMYAAAEDNDVTPLVLTKLQIPLTEPNPKLNVPKRSNQVNLKTGSN